MSMTPTEMRAYLMAAIEPTQGDPIHVRMPGMDGYEMAARCAARAMLIVCEENPRLLDVPTREDDPTGFARATHDAHWQAAKDRWPGLDDWLGGLTGFQFGWANNAVRYALGAEAVGNPALVSIG